MIDNRSDIELYNFDTTYQRALEINKEIPDRMREKYSTYKEGYYEGFIAGMKHSKSGKLISGVEMLTLVSVAFKSKYPIILTKMDKLKNWIGI